MRADAITAVVETSWSQARTVFDFGRLLGVTASTDKGVAGLTAVIQFT